MARVKQMYMDEFAADYDYDDYYYDTMSEQEQQAFDMMVEIQIEDMLEQRYA